MLLLVALVAAVVLLATVAVGAGLGGGLAAARRDQAWAGLPERRLTATDLLEVRFDLAVRGYRMAEVDELVERLATELAARDARIAELEQVPAGGRATERAAGADPATSDGAAERG